MYYNQYMVEGTKICCDCKENKPLEAFSKASSRQDGHQTACKSCASVRRKQRYEAKNKEEREQNRQWHTQNKPWLSKDRKAYMRQWKSENSDRVSVWTANRRALLKTTGTIKLDDWVALCDKYDNKCLKCGSENRISIDHIVPISKGGTNTIDNVQPLCLPCNVRKGAQTIDYRPLERAS